MFFSATSLHWPLCTQKVLSFKKVRVARIFGLMKPTSKAALSIWHDLKGRVTKGIDTLFPSVNISPRSWIFRVTPAECLCPLENVFKYGFRWLSMTVNWDFIEKSRQSRQRYCSGELPQIRSLSTGRTERFSLLQHINRLINELSVLCTYIFHYPGYCFQRPF